MKEKKIVLEWTAIEGKTGVTVTLVRVSSEPYQFTTGTVDIDKMANYEKQVPIEWIDIFNASMLPPFMEYARPLIQGELAPIYVDGLPQHLVLEK